MAVFRFNCVYHEGGYRHETGTLVASDRYEATEMLIEAGYEEVWLRRLQGVQALLGRLTAYSA